MNYHYKVVPFIGQSRGRISPEDVAAQLENLISQYTANGWEFYQLSDVNIEVQPGCLAGLFGAKVQYARFDQLIFRSREDAQISLTRPEVDQAKAREEQTVSSSPSGYRERQRSPAVVSKHLQVWRKKSNNEVHEAIVALNEYTPGAREVILAEFERRSLYPVSEAEREALDMFRSNGVLQMPIGDNDSDTGESDRTEQESLSYCYHCGADISAGSSSCGACGKTL